MIQRQKQNPQKMPQKWSHLLQKVKTRQKTSSSYPMSIFSSKFFFLLFFVVTSLPVARVRAIMKSSPDSENIGANAVLLVTKATEMFIQQMAREAHANSKKPKMLDYWDLAEVVDGNDKLEFLSTIIPKKITMRKFKKLMKADAEEGEFDSMESEDGEEEEEEEEESGVSFFCSFF